MSDLMVAANSGAIVKHGFGETAVTPYAETAAQAVAAREQAAIQARYIMAIQRPRKVETFRVKLLEECKRTGFAEVARYSKPMGGTNIEGPSIRFVEAALRYFQNIDVNVSTVYDSPEMRICRVVVTDMEGNLGYATEIQVQKTVERKNGKGREVIGERTNTYGDKVYIVVATDDEILVKQAALVSKAIRTQGLRLLPGDVVEEAQQLVIATMSKGVVDDPKAAIRKLIDAFAEYRITPDDLVSYIGKPLDRMQPKDITKLRTIFSAIRDGETNWDEVMEEENPSGSVEAAQEVARRKLADIEAAKTPKTVQQHSEPEPEPRKEQGPPTEVEEPKKTEPAAPKPRTERMKL